MSIFSHYIASCFISCINIFRNKWNYSVLFLFYPTCICPLCFILFLYAYSQQDHSGYTFFLLFIGMLPNHGVNKGAQRETEKKRERGGQPRGRGGVGGLSFMSHGSVIIEPESSAISHRLTAFTPGSNDSWHVWVQLLLDFFSFK